MMRRRLLPLSLLVCTASCGGGGGGADAQAAIPPGAVLEHNFPLAVPDPQPLAAVPAVDVVFQQPVFASVAPGEAGGSLYVLEQAGRILRVSDAEAGRAESFLDLRDRVYHPPPIHEMGLLGLAFDPDYGRNGFFYLHYTATDPLRSVISRFSRSALDPARADPDSERILLEVDQPFTNHNAGMLAFGPDGYLYVAFGDGGSGGDPLGHGQNLETLLGSMLRIDPRSAAPYVVPADNPFVGVGGGVRPEIWAYGLRNPWRFSFDPVSGELWLGDVGQNRREEISLITRGGNYGWREWEGTRNGNPTGTPQRVPFTPPIHDYDRSVGVSVIGGVVYRGDALPELRGAYLFADYGADRIWALVREPGGGVDVRSLATVDAPVSFGVGADGEPLVVSLAGTVYRLQRASPAPGPDFPRRLSDTGLFEDTASLEPAAGMLSYDVTQPFWSDGADKQRWLGRPAQQIVFRRDGVWDFPASTILVKHFSWNGRRIETRVLLREVDGWTGRSYRWNEEQNDAELLNGALVEELQVPDPSVPGGSRTIDWEYPGADQCARCHTQAAGVVLGLRNEQLGAEAIARWAAAGVFEETPDLDGLPVLPLARVTDRARTLLDVNCAPCHRPGGPAPVVLDLRWDTPLPDTGLLNLPQAGDLGIEGARVLAPGDRARSVLWQRMARRDEHQMPPLGSRAVDAEALTVIGAWIDALPASAEQR